jgi:hypothetical protein
MPATACASAAGICELGSLIFGIVGCKQIIKFVAGKFSGIQCAFLFGSKLSLPQSDRGGTVLHLDYARSVAKTTEAVLPTVFRQLASAN